MPDEDPAALAVKAYSQLFTLAIHEFRTPISVVGGYLRMLQRDVSTPLADRHRKMVEEAEKSCMRLAVLVGELEEIAKLDDPLTPLQQRTFDLFAMVREVAGGTQEASDRGVHLQTRGEATGATMTGDEIRLQAAFSALLRAVLREQPDGTMVVLDIRLIGDDARRSAVMVIAREDEIASASAAAPSPLDEKRGGLGLALPIARRVIERHGGRIWSPPAQTGAFGSKGAALVSLPLPH